MKNKKRTNKHLLSLIAIATLSSSTLSFGIFIVDAICFGDIFKAIKENNIPEIENILKKKFLLSNLNINNANFKKETPIYWACRNNNLDMVRLFLGHGAKKTINKASHNGKTPIYWACRNNNLDMVILLLQNRARESINKAGHYNETPLYWACKNNNLDMVILLLNNRAQESVNKANILNETPLYWACKNNNLDMVILLLQNGAKESVNKAHDHKYTPIYWACKNNNLDMVKLLLNNGAKETINKANNFNETPFSLAYNNNNLEIIILLIENGVKFSEKEFNINKADINDETLLYKACRNNNLNMVKLLFKKGAKDSVNKASHNGDTPLSLACKNNNLEMVKFLLKNACRAQVRHSLGDDWKLDESSAQDSVNITNNVGDTPINWACINNNIEIVNLLLENGAKDFANKVGHTGDTPIYSAFKVNNPEIVELLCKSIARENGTQESLDKADNEGKTQLHRACLNNDTRMIKLLLKYICLYFDEIGVRRSVSIVDNSGKTALHYACAHNNPEIIKLLLDSGAQRYINTADNDGKTPLHIACEKDHTEIIKVLLENGADIDIVANRGEFLGQTPHNIALQKNNLLTLRWFDLARNYKDANDEIEFIMEMNGTLQSLKNIEEQEVSDNLLFLIKLDFNRAIESYNNSLTHEEKEINFNKVKTLFSLINFNYEFINDEHFKPAIKFAMKKDIRDNEGKSIIDAIMTHDIKLKYMPYIFEKNICGQNNTEKINKIINPTLDLINKSIKQKENAINSKNPIAFITNVMKKKKPVLTGIDEDEKKRFRNLTNSLIVIEDLTKELPLDIVGQIMCFAGTNFGNKVSSKCLAHDKLEK